MRPVTELDVPEGFSLVESEGLAWLEASLIRGVVRFTLAYDRNGEEVDLGLPPANGSDYIDTTTGNRMAMARAMGLSPEAVCVVAQVHGGTVLQLFPGEGNEGFVPAIRSPHDADGMVTTDDHAVLAVSVADCAAIAVSGEMGRGLLHCGWRGMATDMIERTVKLVDGIEAVIGPCIGPCCFEVGPEVSQRLAVERTDEGTIDLGRHAAARLRAAGVQEIRTADLCTFCNSDLFFSFRRQGEFAGRQMALFSSE